MWKGDWTTCRRVLVFGGSFDPPHWAHVRLPERVRRQVGAEVTLYVPAGRSPFKRERTLTEAHHRIRMLELALADQNRAAIWTDEIERQRGQEPSYTVETLERLRAKLGEGATIRLLIGGDQLRAFDRWKEPDRIVELAELVVMVRLPDTREKLLTELPAGFDPKVWAGRIVDVPGMAVSSTEIRRRVAAGEPIEGLTPPAVAAYIRAWGGYGGGNDGATEGGEGDC